MRKLLLAALVATLGLARAAEPSAPAQPGAETKPAADAKAPKQKHKAPEKAGEKTPPAKPAPAAKEAGGTGAKPDLEKPCEPVKPCPIDG